ncbi:hypothetical protein K502DRAFT_324659 [Neoconidiobolus thromboides FSU 785]|nr:hypothetical protein K502DRAFT_324659 [Neoconidiobolus thromboides FSU 785]
MLVSDNQVIGKKYLIRSQVDNQSKPIKLAIRSKPRSIFDLGLNEDIVKSIQNKLTHFPYKMNAEFIKIIGTKINNPADIHSVYLISEWLIKEKRDYNDLNHRKRSVGIYGEFIYRNHIYGNKLEDLKQFQINTCLNLIRKHNIGNEDAIILFFTNLNKGKAISYK